MESNRRTIKVFVRWVHGQETSPTVSCDALKRGRKVDERFHNDCRTDMSTIQVSVNIRFGVLPFGLESLVAYS